MAPEMSCSKVVRLLRTEDQGAFAVDDPGRALVVMLGQVILPAFENYFLLRIPAAVLPRVAEPLPVVGGDHREQGRVCGNGPLGLVDPVLQFEGVVDLGRQDSPAIVITQDAGQITPLIGFQQVFQDNCVLAAALDPPDKALVVDPFPAAFPVFTAAFQFLDGGKEFFLSDANQALKD